VVRVPGSRSRGPGFDSRRFQIFWKVVGTERGPFSFVSTIEELLGRKSSGWCLETWEYGSGAPLRWPRDTHYPQKLETWPTSSSRSVSRVPSRTKATERCDKIKLSRFKQHHLDSLQLPHIFPSSKCSTVKQICSFIFTSTSHSPTGLRVLLRG
jgi:hypothetical protein